MTCNELSSKLASLHQSTEQKVTLVSGDDRRFVVPVSITNLSKSITNVLNDVGSDEELPLPNVDGKTLEQILFWMHYRTANPVAEIPFDPFYDTEGRKKPKYTPRIAGWDIEYCNMIKENEFYAGIWPVMIAANYLEIEPLIKMIANLIRSLLRGWKDDDYEEFDAEKIRKIFGLTNLYTPEQEEAIKKAVEESIEAEISKIPEDAMVEPFEEEEDKKQERMK